MEGIVEYSGTLAGSLGFVASGSWLALFCVELTHVSTKGEGTRRTREPGGQGHLCIGAQTSRLRVWFFSLAVSV